MAFWPGVFDTPRATELNGRCALNVCVIFRRSFHASTRLFSDAPGAHTPSDRVKKLAEEIPQLNLIEVNDLLKLLQVQIWAGFVEC